MGKNQNHRNSHSRRKIRANLFDLQNGQCFWCGCRLTMEANHPGRPPRNYATIDELMPRVRGGTKARVNIVLSCVPCNEGRGSRIAPEWAFARVADRERAIP